MLLWQPLTHLIVPAGKLFSPCRSCVGQSVQKGSSFSHFLVGSPSCPRLPGSFPVSIESPASQETLQSCANQDSLSPYFQGQQSRKLLWHKWDYLPWVPLPVPASARGKCKPKTQSTALSFTRCHIHALSNLSPHPQIILLL